MKISLIPLFDDSKLLSFGFFYGIEKNYMVTKYKKVYKIDHV